MRKMRFTKVSAICTAGVILCCTVLPAGMISAEENSDLYAGVSELDGFQDGAFTDDSYDWSPDWDGYDDDGWYGADDGWEADDTGEGSSGDDFWNETDEGSDGDWGDDLTETEVQDDVPGDEENPDLSWDEEEFEIPGDDEADPEEGSLSEAISGEGVISEAEAAEVSRESEAASGVIASGVCGDPDTNGECSDPAACLMWSLTGDGAFSVLGEGKMQNWGAPEEVPWDAYRDQIRVIRISEGIESIGAYAFCDCTNVEVTEIPEGSIEIGESAFGCCSGLEELSIG